MFKFTLNQDDVTVAGDKNLLEYLREDARLTSVKDGCAEGVCGSCSVLVDGKAWRACKLTIAKIQGKQIKTIEDLSSHERDVYAWAFGKVGAVQCGFCMPGAVMSAKSLLDANPTPAPAEVKSAIRYNLCRCTGYSKIEQAIHLAAEALQVNAIPDGENRAGKIGTRTVRVDSTEKLLGTGEFVDDMQVPGMLHGAVLRAKHPRALVQKIDVSVAQTYPGVVVVLTAKDVPGERLLGHIVHDWPVMVAEGEETRHVGDALVVLAAETKEVARKALELIRVDYEVLNPLLSPADQIAEIGDVPSVGSFDCIIDARGMIVCPGFIDTHSHSDLEVMVNPYVEAKVRQGVTTELLGQDGISMAPLPKKFISPWRKNLAGLDGDSDELRWDHETTDRYLRALETKGVGLNEVTSFPTVISAWRRWASTIASPRPKNSRACATSPGAKWRSATMAFPPASFTCPAPMPKPLN